MDKQDKIQLVNLGVYLTFSCAFVCLVASLFGGDQRVTDWLRIVGVVMAGLWFGLWLFGTTLKYRP